ncbi:MAG: S-layer homology domain-containing protein [Marinisporobacter sp.]|jgi:hypothetical protein|nr:S-layer homology domain-containing protein [Marinisporobacter sp.]
MKRKISFVLIMLMFAMSTVGSFAAVMFSDVPSNHWAKPYITKMADKKIISGYFDNNTLKVAFKPDKSVTYIEAIQMIYNTLKAANKLQANVGLTAKYASVLQANKIDTWAHEAVAYALEYNIVHQDELKVFMKNGNSVYAKKVDIAVFIGKALKMKLEAIPVLNFVDAETIKTAALPYVDLLEKNNIVGGDALKKFNPNSIINRAVMATMCSKTYDLLVSQTSTVIPPKPTTTSTEGTVDYVSTDAKMLVIKDGTGNTKAYTLKAAYIKKDGKYINMNELSSGNRVKLTFDQAGEVASVEVMGSSSSTGSNLNLGEKEGIIDYIAEDSRMLAVKNASGNVEGYNLSGVIIKRDGKNISMKDLNKGDGIKLIFDKKGQLDIIEVNNGITKWQGKIESVANFGSYYLMTIRNKDNLILKKDLKIYDNTEIKFDGKNVDISKLVTGENVDVKFIGDRAISIDIASKEVVYDGILESAVMFKSHPTLQFRANGDQIMEYEIDDNVTIRRDRRRAELSDLKKGDIATITVDHGKIVEILAASRDERTRDEGVIKQIIIGDPTKITIVTEDKKEITYDVDESVDIEIDDKDAKLRDLDVHYEVRLTLEHGEVTAIRADKVSFKNTISGEIEKIYADYNYLVIKYFDSSKNEYISKTVFVPKKANIVSKTGTKLQIGNLGKRTTIIVNGYYDDNNFTATNIIELN